MSMYIFTYPLPSTNVVLDCVIHDLWPCHLSRQSCPCSRTVLSEFVIPGEEQWSFWRMISSREIIPSSVCSGVRSRTPSSWRSKSCTCVFCWCFFRIFFIVFFIVFLSSSSFSSCFLVWKWSKQQYAWLSCRKKTIYWRSLAMSSALEKELLIPSFVWRSLW